jgi:hypothetical protein
MRVPRLSCHRALGGSNFAYTLRLEHYAFRPARASEGGLAIEGYEMLKRRGLWIDVDHINSNVTTDKLKLSDIKLTHYQSSHHIAKATELCFKLKSCLCLT